jgi:hypothetical protein
MKKLFFFLSLAISATLWAAAPSKVQIYDRPNGGFIAIDETGEVVAYSEQGTLSAISDEMRSAWRSIGFDPQLTHQQAPARLQQVVAEIIDSVGPLLGDIRQHQYAPYYNMTPVVAGQHCVTGCVATAMATIMTYWQHPKTCHGSMSYKTDAGRTITESFEGYEPDWNNILHNYNQQYTEEQGNAIAQLVYYCGVSVKMDYDTDGSGTQSELVPDALFTNFDFSIDAQMVYKADYTDSQWFNLIKTELQASRPLFAASKQQSGSGHAYVLDGCQMSKTSTRTRYYYHYDWGWGGVSNGWYQTPKTDEMDLSYNQSVIIQIYPAGYTADPQIVMSEDTNAPVFDILGRRVSELTPGQIYIRNGRKFMAR